MMSALNPDPVPSDIANWKPRLLPPRYAHTGRYVRLEPLDPARHGDDLFAASSGLEAERLWRYLADHPYPDRRSFETWLTRNATSTDPMFFAVVDRASGHAEGRLALMRMSPEHGVIEVGHILFGTRIEGTRMATEAIFLVAKHVFDDLGYRRFEWKCDNENEPSKRAALRFGFSFEGVFRQHMVVKEKNRDTAWYAMLDREWSLRRLAFERWLASENFDDTGKQKMRLNDVMRELQRTT
jgi:RimJ/RimL family protein N-acetyltransferase